MVIQVLDKKFQPYIRAAQIQEEVARLGAQMNADYAGKNPLFIAILNGSFMFASDLFKELTVDAEICFIKLASYKGTRSTGNVITSIGLDESLKGRHVVIVEDIVDTGRTLHFFINQLQIQAPASICTVTFLRKPEAAAFPVQVDLVGFDIEDKFVVGYGLDYEGLGRNLPGVYQLPDEG